MYINIKFAYDGRNWEYTRSVDELARNYDDESYAYFLEGVDDNLGFEINILKDDDGNLIEEGYMVAYDGQFCDELEGIAVCHDAEVKFLNE